MVRLVADVDTGIDDMLALMYLAGLHRMGEIELAGVTATAGNTTVCQAARNSRWVLDLCGLPDVPVAAGYGAPLRVPLTTTPETHGEFGLGFARPPSASACDAAGAAPGLWDRVLADGPASLLVTGPLTTVARHPELASRFDAVTVMGGAVDHPGNTTRTAEWNFWVDPDATREVLDSGLRLTLCPLDVTETVTVDPSHVESWGLGGELGPVVAAALRFYFGFHRGQGLGYLAQVHDLFAAMVACGAVDVGTQSLALRAADGDRGAVARGEGEASVDVVTSADPAAVHAEFERVLDGGNLRK